MLGRYAHLDMKGCFLFLLPPVHHSIGIEDLAEVL